MTAEEYLTISEVAAICKVSRDTIKDRMRKGVYRLGVHYFRPGSARPRFKKSALIAWIEGEDVKTGERQDQPSQSIPMARGYVLGERRKWAAK